MISIYRAMLGASLAVRIFKEPVSELEELLLSDKLQLIIVGRFSKYVKTVSASLEDLYKGPNILCSILYYPNMSAMKCYVPTVDSFITFRIILLIV